VRDLGSEPGKETPSLTEIASVPQLRRDHLQNFLPDLLTFLDLPPRERSVADVGVLAGDSSVEIRTRNQPRRLLLLDSFVVKGDRLALISERFKNQIQDGRVVFREGHSWDELAELEDRSLDWIYIDADHDDGSALRDLEAARSKVKDSGFIVMNDSALYELTQGVPFRVIDATRKSYLKHTFKGVVIDYLGRLKKSLRAAANKMLR
jgi:predicted O-methyltransferase YrrM